MVGPSVDFTFCIPNTSQHGLSQPDKDFAAKVFWWCEFQKHMPVGETMFLWTSSYKKKKLQITWNYSFWNLNIEE